MHRIKFLTAEGTRIKNPTPQDLRANILDTDDEYRAHGMVDAMIQIFDQDDRTLGDLIISYVPTGLFCVTVDCSTISTDTFAKGRLRMYDGQEFAWISRANLVNAETAYSAALEFCRTGKRAKGTVWIPLNAQPEAEKHIEYQDEYWRKNVNTDWD